MFNPLVDSFEDLSDNEVEDKVQELSRKYFLAKNAALQAQVGAVLQMFKEEAKARRAKSLTQNNNNDDNNSLDNLINIS